MDYIRHNKSVSTTSITVCIMERHQAEQKETLVRVETDSLEVAHLPRGSPADRHRGCFKCVVALATVMGLVIVALVGGFILHFFVFTPSCNQASPPLDDTAKVNITCKLTNTGEQGRYDIFTVNKAAAFLIYGWVTFSDNSSKTVTLTQTWGGRVHPLQTQTENKKEMFFFDRVKLVSHSRISIHFESTYIDNLFHVYEL